MCKKFRSIWNSIKRQLLIFLISSWSVWLAAVLSLISAFIFGWEYSIWVFFGGVGVFILYIFLRQIYWWFTGKSDYEGRGFPKLWK